VYVFVVLDVGTRRIVHWNVTEHPTAAGTVQQFRASVPGDQPQPFLIHDRDSIYAAAVDDAVKAMGLTVVKTPVRCPQANAFCERLIGTIRRECLDWLIVLNERHLRFVLREWVVHYFRVDHTPASVPAFPTRRPRSSRVQAGITLLPSTESPPHRSWGDCITSIGWSHWRLDRTGRCWPGCNYCGRQASIRAGGGKLQWEE
jgi:transposase InsO family protein